jgi:hypothetical protein
MQTKNKLMSIIFSEINEFHNQNNQKLVIIDEKREETKFKRMNFKNKTRKRSMKKIIFLVLSLIE